MRRGNEWLEYLNTLSAQASTQTRDLAAHISIYAYQWAHDVRCVRQGVEHRRVGAAAQRNDWLCAGMIARPYNKAAR